MEEVASASGRRNERSGHTEKQRVEVANRMAGHTEVERWRWRWRWRQGRSTLTLASTRARPSSIAARIGNFWQCQPGVTKILRAIGRVRRTRTPWKNVRARGCIMQPGLRHSWCIDRIPERWKRRTRCSFWNTALHRHVCNRDGQLYCTEFTIALPRMQLHTILESIVYGFVSLSSEKNIFVSPKFVHLI